MSIDLERIKENYASFDDYKLEHLAKNEAAKLDSEVISILMAEIKKRGLDSNLEKGIEAQTKELTESEINELISKIINITCPACGQKNTPLVGSIIRTVRSFILLTYYEKTFFISCRSCAKNKKKMAMITTALLGWWGLAGIIRTPIALITTMKDNKKQESISDEIITDFVIGNIGEIRTNWEKEDELVEYLGHVNSLN